MTVASEITRIEGNIAAAYTAAEAKGATIPSTENSDNLATCIGTISGGGGGTGKYALFDRVIDDNNNEIGTVSGFFTDANNTEYAVVYLDDEYKPNEALGMVGRGGYVAEFSTFVRNIWSSDNKTSTSLCDAILNNLHDSNSPAIDYCRSLSFTIDEVTYHGQLPNFTELFDILKNSTELAALDNNSTYFSGLIGIWVEFITSTFCRIDYESFSPLWIQIGIGGQGGVKINELGELDNNFINKEYNVIPVLEIPNN